MSLPHMCGMDKNIQVLMLDKLRNHENKNMRETFLLFHHLSFRQNDFQWDNLYETEDNNKFEDDFKDSGNFIGKPEEMISLAIISSVCI